MKSLKKFLSIILMSCLIIGMFSGCEKSSSGSGGSTKVLFLMTDTKDTFRGLLSKAIVKAAKDDGIDLKMVETGESIEEQLKLVKNAKAEGYTAIIMRVADPDVALQMQVASNDIPIIYVNAQPSDTILEPNKYVYVGSAEEQAGLYQAEYAWEKLGKPNSFNAVILEGEKGHSATIGRTTAIKNYFKDNGVDVNYVFVDFCDWDSDETEEKLGIFFNTKQKYDVVFCNNDSMALGAVKALKKHGDSLEKVPVLGVDATADGCQSIKNGEMQFTVLQDANGQAKYAVETSKALSLGKKVSSVKYADKGDKYVWVPFKKIDSSNVSSVSQ
ncbi:substrate-binding domain-containing protein [Lachnobacterium bovis]|uniref:substrate-binding domain-containing protein n=1 Tax=Lachnobacterium bovis TaxID=140626 RepID=UPI0004804EAA|nr:substrate-binding domain-containing protein [Lachnobacterium bovis]